jgi:hypothetical protein
MKQSATSSSPDQNWHWPEKTWFRERLNAIKAREQETRRKAETDSAIPDQPIESETPANSNLKAD